jgi:hypothetical protein
MAASAKVVLATRMRRTQPQGVCPPGLAPIRSGAPRLDLVPWWAWIWYYLPFIDRYAHAWMWRAWGLDGPAAGHGAGAHWGTD